MSSKSTVKPPENKPTKPEKPRADFPLYPHLSGKWAKTIRGRTFYFGTWDDPEGALNEYLDVRDDLYVGRTPMGRGNVFTIKDLCNDFHHHCKAKVEAGEMVERTFRDYTATTDRIVRAFGKRQSVEGLRPNDFAKLRADITRSYGPVALANEITRVRTVFHFAKKNLLIQTDVQFGMAFERPSRKTMRQARAKNGKRMFTADECRSLIDNAQTPELKTMILLALNCGFGNADCAKVTLEAVDLKRDWIDYARPKTGVERRCPLWPETVAALQVVLERRERRERLCTAKNKGKASDLLFLTKFGTSYEQDQTTITNEFGKLLDELKLRKPGRGFYALRHVFRTIADATKDFPTIRLIMGHVDESIDAYYREGIEDDRLRAVVDHVRAWLWPADQEVSGGRKVGRWGMRREPT